MHRYQEWYWQRHLVWTRAQAPRASMIVEKAPPPRTIATSRLMLQCKRILITFHQRYHLGRPWLKEWPTGSSKNNFVDALTKIATLVISKKLDAYGHKAYNAAVETIADYIHKNLHTHKRHTIAAKEQIMADFTAASFIFGCVLDEAFPMQEWAKGG